LKGGQKVDQKKIGTFLKELRKEKGITQEQFAEHLGTSGRTISRWETGNNMPDISLLIEIAEFFDVSIPEIINGERKSESMNKESKEVAETLSEYATAEKEKMIKDIRTYSIMGTVALIVYFILDASQLISQNVIYEKIAVYCETLVFVTVMCIFALTTGMLNKLRKKQQASNLYTKLGALPKPIQLTFAAIVAFASAVVIKLFLTSVLGL